MEARIASIADVFDALTRNPQVDSASQHAPTIGGTGGQAFRELGSGRGFAEEVALQFVA